MSTIIIDSPYDDCNVCATCLQMQLTSFRNKIKERWNQLRNDGKLKTVRIPIELDPLIPMEMAATIVNGNLCCVTHMFNAVNNSIEMNEQLSKEQKVPRLELPNATVDPKKLRG